MAAIGVYSTPKMEYVEGRCISSIHSSTSLKLWPMIGRTGFPIRRKRLEVNCSLPNTMSPLESEEDAATLSSSDSLEDEFSHVTKFKMSDFKIRNRVSIGLGGRVMESPWLFYSNCENVFMLTYNIGSWLMLNIGLYFVLCLWQGDEIVFEAMVNDPHR